MSNKSPYLLASSTRFNPAKSGLRKSDVILSINAAPTVDVAALLSQGAAPAPGRPVGVGISRGQKAQILTWSAAP
ncbi:MAG: hypothetical protein ABIZ81_14130 [Opitutaceae bacterium]